MNSPSSIGTVVPESTAARTAELLKEQQQSIVKHTDLIFARLMICQWVFGVILALCISPRSWSGSESTVHLHIWAAILLGGLISSVPVLLGFKRPGEASTRHAIAVGQMLMSALLIHLTGGRIETHFHVFGSLAILAFYRDWKVLISASTVVYLDHVLRGIFWPESVYGVVAAPIWRSLEHAGWVIFEVSFLLISIRKSLSEMLLVAERQARLEALKQSIEQTVAERTADLTRENMERREAEKQLRRSQAQLAQAQQIARLGSWEWDVTADTVISSLETDRLLGRTHQESGSAMAAYLERVHSEDLPRFEKAIAETVRNGRPFLCEHRVVWVDGEERTLQTRGEIVSNGYDASLRMLGTVQDITEAKRAEEALRRSEEQLRQAQKMEAVGRLAGGVAHDFNNLLTVITGYSGLTLQRMEETNPFRKCMAEILKASERAAALTSQLLAFSRKQVLQPRVLQLNEVVHGMEKMLSRLIGEDIELATVYDSPVGQVKADPGQIEQVIMNLAINARDAMPRGGKLTISITNVTVDQETKFRNRTLDVGDYVMMAISDNGLGMTEAVKEHLFEPFFTTKGVGKGTGLGLATCYGIVAQSGGDIRVYSEPNFGTTFKIYLPRTDAPVQPATLLDEPQLPCGTESILIVEDDPSVRELAVIILSERGYHVEESTNGLAALEVIKNRPPFDLVLTDVIMPHMSGKELYDNIRKCQPETKVLLMSGYTDDALAHHGVLDEDLSFLEKPFSASRLARKVREVLEAPALHPSRRALQVSNHALCA